MNANKRALLVWENGGGLGHAKRLLKMALALRTRGFEPLVVARDIFAAQADYRRARVPLLQAPKHRGLVTDPRKYRARSFADIMATCAWDDADALEDTVYAWDSLIDATRPALVVADYCQIVPLSALGRIPLVTVGDGFVVPPGNLEAMPVFWKRATLPDEEALRANGEEVLARRGRPQPIASLSALIAGDRSVVCTFPETDVYGRVRAEPAVGPLDRDLPLPPPGGPGLFVYLDWRQAGTAKAMEGAAASGLPVRAFLRNATPAGRDVWRARGVFVHDRAPNLVRELGRASAILHHGGIGTSETAIATGRAQLVMPRHLEQDLNANLLARLGVAAQLKVPFRPADAEAGIRHVCESASVREQAAAVAETVAARPPMDVLAHLADICESLAA